MKNPVSLFMIVLVLFMSTCGKNNTQKKSPVPLTADDTVTESMSSVLVTLSPWGSVEVVYQQKKGKVSITLNSEKEKIISFYPESALDMHIQGINIALDDDINSDGFQDLTLLINGYPLDSPDITIHRVISLIHNKSKGFNQNPDWDKWATSQLQGDNSLRNVEFLMKNLRALGKQYKDW